MFSNLVGVPLKPSIDRERIQPQNILRILRRSGVVGTSCGFLFDKFTLEMICGWQYFRQYCALLRVKERSDSRREK